MKLKELVSYLNQVIPPAFQEDYDNSGLQVGDQEMEISKALLSIDVTDEVVNEAAETGCDLIISHHPLIFRGLKNITSGNVTGNLILKAIKNNIAVLSLHTNLDAIEGGVSWKMAEKLGLKDVRVLSPSKDHLLKLVVYVPGSALNRVRDAVFNAGAGFIGNYDRCGFTSDGTGSFRGGEGTNPYAGEKGKISFEPEVRFETILYRHDRNRIEQSLLAFHPYEEPAYDFYPLENQNSNTGMGCVGTLEKPVSESGFLKHIASVFGSGGIRHSSFTGRKVEKVALCGGAGSSLINNAIGAGADIFITADIRYHSFFDASGRILLADIGHFESEKFTVEVLNDLIIKKFPTFALRFSEINTNPINYLI